MCFTVQLSRFLSFFSRDSFYIISKLFLFVKNFFNFFQSFLSVVVVFRDSYIRLPHLHQLVNNFFIFSLGFYISVKTQRKKRRKNNGWKLQKSMCRTELMHGSPKYFIERRRPRNGIRNMKSSFRRSRR